MENTSVSDMLVKVETLLTNALALDFVKVTSNDGSHFNVIAVGSCFDGLTPVKRQQAVYGPLMELIASNAMHAVNIKTFTPEQFSRDRKLMGL